MIRFGADVCGNLEAASQREWLETNGLGGFASSTITGLNTRRYHGLLVAGVTPPAGRILLLSKLEEALITPQGRFDLASNQYPAAIYPEGYRHLTEFRLDPFPIFTFRIGDLQIEKSVFLIHGENGVVVEYLLRGASAGSTRLELRPLIAFRDYHATTHANPALNRSVQTAPGLASVTPYAGLPELHFAHNAQAIDVRGDWYYHFEYEREQERGLDYDEDLYNPFTLTFDLGFHAQAVVIASTEVHRAAEAYRLRRAEVERRAAITQRFAGEPTRARLAAAADQFIVARGEQSSVIAGYHWFTDWGRDTMISLPGLTLATGRTDIAKSILLAYAGHVDRGMLPNRFPETGGQPEYNSVDATLWFFEAVRALGDYEFISGRLYETLADIISWLVRGTRFGIHADADGLLAAGEPGVQLTWMDAKVGDWVVTPRHGKPVEVQALWYNALRVMEELARRFGDDAGETRYGEMAALARAHFESLFWNDSAGCLYDVINGTTRDASIRPNQIFAVSLAHSMLSAPRAARVVEVVERELLTPYGLRTLATSDPAYRGRYAGDQRSRDGAYHQGTVWPWLMGPFVTAFLKVRGCTPETRSQVERWLAPLREYLTGSGVGQIPEIFDGDPPHHPRGTIAQAWSVAELARALWSLAGEGPTLHAFTL